MGRGQVRERYRCATVANQTGGPLSRIDSGQGYRPHISGDLDYFELAFDGVDGMTVATPSDNVAPPRQSTTFHVAKRERKVVHAVELAAAQRCMRGSGQGRAVVEALCSIRRRSPRCVEPADGRLARSWERGFRRRLRLHRATGVESFVDAASNAPTRGAARMRAVHGRRLRRRGRSRSLVRHRPNAATSRPELSSSRVNFR